MDVLFRGDESHFCSTRFCSEPADDAEKKKEKDGQKLLRGQHARASLVVLHLIVDTEFFKNPDDGLCSAVVEVMEGEFAGGHDGWRWGFQRAVSRFDDGDTGYSILPAHFSQRPWGTAAPIQEVSHTKIHTRSSHPL